MQYCNINEVNLRYFQDIRHYLPYFPLNSLSNSFAFVAKRFQATQGICPFKFLVRERHSNSSSRNPRRE